MHMPLFHLQSIKTHTLFLVASCIDLSVWWLRIFFFVLAVLFANRKKINRSWFYMLFTAVACGLLECCDMIGGEIKRWQQRPCNDTVRCNRKKRRTFLKGPVSRITKCNFPLSCRYCYLALMIVLNNMSPAGCCGSFY